MSSACRPRRLVLEGTTRRCRSTSTASRSGEGRFTLEIVAGTAADYHAETSGEGRDSRVLSLVVESLTAQAHDATA